MTRNGPELSGFARNRWRTSYPVAQQKTDNNRTCPDLWVANPLVAGSSPARPTGKQQARTESPGQFSFMNITSATVG